MKLAIEMTVDDRQARAAFERVIETLDRSERGLVALRCWHRLYGWPEARRATAELHAMDDSSGRGLFRRASESLDAFRARLRQEVEPINRASAGS